MKTAKGIEIAKYLCLSIGAFLIVSGLLLLFSPVAASVLYDFREIATFKEPMALAMGIRQLAIGLIFITLSLTNQIKALAYVMLIGAIVPLADFLIFLSSIGSISALRHLAPVPMIVGLGFYLLYRLRGNHK